MELAMSTADAAQVLDVLREILIQHMDRPDSLSDFRVQSAVFIGAHSARLISDEQIIDGSDIPGGLRLTMRSGVEYDLMLAPCEIGDNEEYP